MPDLSSLFRARPILLATLVLVAVGLGCGTVGTRVTRVADEEAVDLSGYWNDTDSRQVADEMIQDLLAHPWLEQFQQGKSGIPRVVVGRIRNRTEEHIAAETFVKDLESALTRSGKVRFVANRAERRYMRREREEQAEHATAETAKRPNQEHAADFILQGTVNSIVDEEGGVAVRWYQVVLELLEIESGEKVWIGQTRIKKVVERDDYAL